MVYEMDEEKLRQAKEKYDKIPVPRTRKEKPPRSARRTMRVGGGNGSAKGVVVIGLAILTVIICIIGLLQSMK